ncbi:DUF397 domain-containing protein [Streptomyces sp. NPDC002589]|uniref:DUF397 domain-containing protein n=1 Tax=Streptomyces sp. NPDC002589 TaxID=3154420 RepID=UPI00332212C1
MTPAIRALDMAPKTAWFKSSYSGGEQSQCLMVASLTEHTRALDLAPEDDYFVSSYSGGGNNCIKIATPTAEREYVGVCDSKQDNGPAFAVGADAWKAFIASVA